MVVPYDLITTCALDPSSAEVPAGFDWGLCSAVSTATTTATSVASDTQQDAWSSIQEMFGMDSALGRIPASFFALTSAVLLGTF